MTEGLIIAMLIAAALLIIGYKMRSLPVIFISSLGWLICGMQVFKQTTEVLPMILLFMLAISQFFILKRGD